MQTSGLVQFVVLAAMVLTLGIATGLMVRALDRRQQLQPH